MILCFRTDVVFNCQRLSMPKLHPFDKLRGKTHPSKEGKGVPTATVNYDVLLIVERLNPNSLKIESMPDCGNRKLRLLQPLG